MPRGVFVRKTAQERMSAQASDLAAGVQPVAQKRDRNRGEALKSPQAAAPAPSVQLVAPELLGQPSFYKNKRVNIDTVGWDELKQYARSIGILQRDVDSLTEARLRQNCKARVFESMGD